MDALDFVNQALIASQKLASELRHEFVTPLHLLYTMSLQKPFCRALHEVMIDSNSFSEEVRNLLDTNCEAVPQGITYTIDLSVQLIEMLDRARMMARMAEENQLSVPMLVQSMLQLKDSLACQLLKGMLDEQQPFFISSLVSQYEAILDDEFVDDDEEDYEYEGYSDEPIPEKRQAPWQNYVTCLNDIVEQHNPLIGREMELERTIQVLCRKDKNNPLHVGEPGVGKSALVYGLTERILKGEVPERLKGCKVYELDLPALLAGTQYRGDFEKRLKAVMEGVSSDGPVIVYLDEIHTMIGAGRVNDSSMDASNILKPYLEQDKIRFMGSTTYEEFNRYFAKDKGIVRRFQQIDILEPSIDETIHILEGLKDNYERFHKVKYDADVISFAVNASVKYIHNRFLPDKAIDLIDEAGAYRETHPLEGVDVQPVDKHLLNDVLTRICKVEIPMEDDNNDELAHLQEHLLDKIYGQDKAIQEVVQAVLMSQAGLLDDNKPMANLLFVGPTGVGKTEVARVLAAEQAIPLIRFDMSEYSEKHTVAKLIGSPAGYVGYEDGGLLTDAVRKSPHCVLLLDEIEKAHSDIYNILLQVMDYGVLTDNRGQKSDFRHVILILTSNAGAQYSHQASVGFSGHVSAGEAMMQQVKKTFKPEFLNRLTQVVVFNDMDRSMAQRILNKKLNELKMKLQERKVSMLLSDAAFEWMLEKGFSPIYGARELDRVITSNLKSLLTKEILFGSLKNPGSIASVDVADGKLVITSNESV